MCGSSSRRLLPSVHGVPTAVDAYAAAELVDEPLALTVDQGPARAGCYSARQKYGRPGTVSTGPPQGRSRPISPASRREVEQGPPGSPSPVGCPRARGRPTLGRPAGAAPRWYLPAHPARFAPAPSRARRVGVSSTPLLLVPRITASGSSVPWWTRTRHLFTLFIFPHLPISVPPVVSPVQTFIRPSPVRSHPFHCSRTPRPVALWPRLAIPLAEQPGPRARPGPRKPPPARGAGAPRNSHPQAYAMSQRTRPLGMAHRGDGR